jgi:hypothetical protein
LVCITHIHFQVFLTTTISSTAKATAVSQLAFPDATNTLVYNSKLYTKGQNTTVKNNSEDGEFMDGVTLQLVSITGSVETGLVAEIEVGLAI